MLTAACGIHFTQEPQRSLPSRNLDWSFQHSKSLPALQASSVRGLFAHINQAIRGCYYWWRHISSRGEFLPRLDVQSYFRSSNHRPRGPCTTWRNGCCPVHELERSTCKRVQSAACSVLFRASSRESVQLLHALHSTTCYYWSYGFC